MQCIMIFFYIFSKNVHSARCIRQVVALTRSQAVFATSSTYTRTTPSALRLTTIHNYTVSQKTRHQTLGHNSTNYYPIFKTFSLSD